jgi:hypothetical protein
MGTSALAEPGEQLLTLLNVESHLTAALTFGIKPAVAVLRHSITPPTHRSGRGVDVTCHLPNTPASFRQSDSDASSDFELESSTCRFHGALIGRTKASL